MKYGVRMYAHGRCFLARYGVKGLEQLDLDALMAFPAVVAAEAGALDRARGAGRKRRGMIIYRAPVDPFD